MVACVAKPTDPISRALTTMTKLSPAERKRLVESRPQLERLVEGLYPLEAASRPKLEQTLQIASRLSNRKLKAFDLIDLTPLSWRSKEGFPQIAVFGLNDPRAQFALRRRDWGNAVYSTIPKLPDGYKAQYRDIEQLLKDRRGDRVTLTARWSGVIPLEVKEQIEAVRGEFQEIFVWAEVPEWKLNVEVMPRQSDPLVVGFDGRESWLIAAFDLTPVEEYIRREFAIPQ